MKSANTGNDTLEAEITNLSPHGVWLLAKGKEYFLPHDHYPWFQTASIEEIFDLQLLHGHHLHWPKLDVDLDLSALKTPEKYPLIYT